MVSYHYKPEGAEAGRFLGSYWLVSLAKVAVPGLVGDTVKKKIGGGRGRAIEEGIQSQRLSPHHNKQATPSHLAPAGVRLTSTPTPAQV